MHDYYEKSMRALRLAGLSPSTQKAYTRSVRLLVEFYDKPPEAISETEVEDYFLHRIDETGWSPSTLRICYSGIKFYFVHVLERDWKVFDYLNARHEKRLPSVLSREEVRWILALVATFHNYVFLATVYSCGLRLSEALALEVGDVDSAQMHLHVHRGKGAKAFFIWYDQTDNLVNNKDDGEDVGTHAGATFDLQAKYFRRRRAPRGKRP
jgi:site-specific recombinase XerD